VAIVSNRSLNFTNGEVIAQITINLEYTHGTAAL